MGTDATLDQDELEETRDERGEDTIPEDRPGKPDLDVDGLEPSFFARLRKYLDPKTK